MDTLSLAGSLCTSKILKSYFEDYVSIVTHLWAVISSKITLESALVIYNRGCNHRIQLSEDGHPSVTLVVRAYPRCHHAAGTTLTF